MATAKARLIPRKQKRCAFMFLRPSLKAQWVRGAMPPRSSTSSGGKVLFKIREVDGEPTLTPIGCLFALVAAPFLIALTLTTSVITAIFPWPFDYAEKKRTEKNHKVSEQKNQAYFFRKSGITPEAFWLTEIQYSEVSIPKKTGGTRQLHIPTDELKTLQSDLKRFLASTLHRRVHKCANAYIPGRNTVTNATPHLGCAVLIKLDIVDFFGSIRREALLGCLEGAIHSNMVRQRVADLISLPNGVAQGAPSSPLVSNLCMREFDIEMYGQSSKLGARYTRYSDDITLSLPADDPEKVRILIKMTQRLLRKNGYELNTKKQKLRVLRPHQAQQICGVTINSGKPTISRKQRRLLRAAVHRVAAGKEASLSQEQIEGWHAYIAMVQG